MESSNPAAERQPLLSNPSAGGGLSSATAASLLVKDHHSNTAYGSNHVENSTNNANADSDLSTRGNANGNGENNEANPNAVSKRTLVLILTALWSAVFLGAMDGTIVATLQQPIGIYFNQSHKASYIGTSYLLSVCCFTPLYGRLSDILGRKGAMLLGLFLFTTGTLLCGIAPSMNTLILARAIAGMGGGGVMSVSSITTTDLIPLRDRGLYQGAANILFGAGAGLGGPLGGYINDRFGWRATFLMQIPFLLISSTLVFIYVNIKLSFPPSTWSKKIKRIDWLGSITLVTFVGSLLFAFSFKTSEDVEWSDKRVWIPLIISAVGAVAFVTVELLVSPEPIMPIPLLISRTPLAVALTNFFGSIVAFSVLYNVPLYFMAVRLQTSTDAGLHLLPNAIALSLGSVGAGLIMRRTGKYWRLIVASTLLSFFATTRMALWDQKRTSDFELWADVVPSGVGWASTLTSTLIAIIACVAREDMAVATGITYLFRTTGQVLGVSLSGALFQALLVSNLRKRMPPPNIDSTIDAIRHDASLVRLLDGPQKEAAIESFALALRAVFICQAAVALIHVICVLPIEERPLPGSHEEHEEGHRRRQTANRVDSNEDT